VRELPRCTLTKRQGGNGHGTHGDAGPKKSRDESDVSVSGVRGTLRDPRPCSRNEHVGPILAAGDVRYPDECSPAIRGSSAERPGAHLIQVWKTARIPARLADISHEAACILRPGARIRTARGIHKGGGGLDASDAAPMARLSAPAGAL